LSVERERPLELRLPSSRFPLAMSRSAAQKHARAGFACGIASWTARAARTARSGSSS
jgi:hypothetical protein